MTSQVSAQKVFFIGFCLEAYRQNAKSTDKDEVISRDLRDDINNLLNIMEAVSVSGNMHISVSRVREFRTRVREGITNAVFSSQAFVLREIFHEELRDFCAKDSKGRKK